MNVYHFDVGDSNTGPIGFCARIVAADKAAAVAKLRGLLPTDIDVDPEEPFDDDEEYIAVFINPDAVVEENIDEVNDKDEGD